MRQEWRSDKLSKQLIWSQELIVEEDSAHIDGYRTGALAADHFGLNKFSGPKDGKYISVAGEINAAVQKAGGILKSRQNGKRTPISIATLNNFCLQPFDKA